jgi:hypothetical protein
MVRDDLVIVSFHTSFPLRKRGQKLTHLSPAEITNLRIRIQANALSTCSNWLSNFLIVMITPPAFANLQWKTYLIFGVDKSLSFGNNTANPTDPNSRLQRRHLPLRLALLPRTQRTQPRRAGRHLRQCAREERESRQDGSRGSKAARSGVGARVGEVFRHRCCACLVGCKPVWVGALIWQTDRQGIVGVIGDGRKSLRALRWVDTWFPFV